MLRSVPPGLLLVASALAATATADEPAALTYHRDVAPILQRRCQSCHHEGAIGPFALTTFDEVMDNADTIAEVVGERRMPPWHAAPGAIRFANDRSLDDAERRTLLDWLARGRQEGAPADAPAPVTWPDGWMLGTPDAVLSGGPVDVPAAGVLDYQYFDVATDFGEDRWVKAMEVRVEAPSVVHHVLVFVLYPREAGPSPEVRGGLKGYFCSSLPGDSIAPFPRGAAKLLPRGSRLRFQVHYTPDGEPRRDVVRLGLVFAREDEPITRRAETIALSTTSFRIPAGAREHVVRARYTFAADRVLFGLTPHMHLRGRSFRYLLVYPDGSHQALLEIPRWDFNWQTTYRLAEPLFVPAGSQVVGLATFDNSADNPANPDPGRDVGFGEQTTDEMMIGYMDVLEAAAGDRAAWERARSEPR